MKGFTQVFTFTLSHQLKTNSYRITLLLGALLLFLLPFIGLPMAEEHAWAEDGLFEAAEEEPSDVITENTNAPEIIYFVTDDVPALSGVRAEDIEIPDFNFSRVVVCGSVEEAFANAEQQPSSLIVHPCMEGERLTWNVTLPENAVVSVDAAYALADALTWNSEAILAKAFGMEEKLDAADISTVMENAADPDSQERELEDAMDILSMVVPYLNIMLVYFLVLFYGQGVAQNCIAEKQSKLMDTFLISVRPRALLTGKVLAAVAAACLQVAAFAVAIWAGIHFGMVRAEQIGPQPKSILVILIYMMSHEGGSLMLGNAILAVTMLAAGFLMYCAIASIGGAIASKPEELGGTNILFTLLLVASFLITLQSGVLNTVRDGVTWLDFVPFTAVLVSPCKILLGFVSPWIGMLTMCLTLVFGLLVLVFAGKLYRAMALYRGNAPKPKQILEILKSDR